jgi:hypothetical protein
VFGAARQRIAADEHAAAVLEAHLRLSRVWKLVTWRPSARLLICEYEALPSRPNVP